MPSSLVIKIRIFPPYSRPSLLKADCSCRQAIRVISFLFAPAFFKADFNERDEFLLLKPEFSRLRSGH